MVVTPTFPLQLDAYLVLSTPKQLATALMTTSVCNTTVLQMKPDFWAPCHTTVIPSVPGISELYLAQYIRTDGKQEIKFFNSLGRMYHQFCSMPAH